MSACLAITLNTNFSKRHGAAEWIERQDILSIRDTAGVSLQTTHIDQKRTEKHSTQKET